MSSGESIPMWRSQFFASFAGISISDSENSTTRSALNHGCNALILNLEFIRKALVKCQLEDKTIPIDSLFSQAIAFATILQQLHIEDDEEEIHRMTAELLINVKSALQSLCSPECPHKKFPFLLIPCGFYSGEEHNIISRFLLVIEFDHESRKFCLWLCNGGLGCEHHPFKFDSNGVTRFRTVIKLPGISEERLLDDAVWWMWAHLQTNSTLCGPSMIYEVFIPHLCGSSLESVMSRDTDTDGNNPMWPFESIGLTPPELQACQGCVRLLCNVSGIRNGSDIVTQIEVEFLKRLEAAIEAGIDQRLQILPPDIATIKEACRMISKRLEKFASLEICHLLSNILTRLEVLNKIDLNEAEQSHAIPLAKDSIQMISRYVDFEPYPFFDFFSRTGVQPACGRELPTISPVGFSTVSIPQEDIKTSFKSALSFLEATENLCSLLRVNAGGLPDIIWHTKIISIVQQAFTQMLPIPQPNQKCAWPCGTEDIKTLEQRKCLKCIYSIARYYCQAVRSLDYKCADQSRDIVDKVLNKPELAAENVHIVVMASILSIFDCVLRMDVNRPKDQDFLVGDIISGRRGKPLGLCLKSFDGIRDLRFAFEHAEIHAPHLLEPMMNVLRYFEDSEHSKHPKLFDWDLSPKENDREMQFFPRKDDCTLIQLFKPLLENRGPRFLLGPAPKPKHAEYITSAKDKQQVKLLEHEILVTWGCADWNTDPEVAMIRELTLLFKILMEPKLSMPSEYNTSEIKWYYLRRSSTDISLIVCEDDINRAVKIASFGNSRLHIVGVQSTVKLLLDDVKNKTLPQPQKLADLPTDSHYLRTTLNLDDVLYASSLPTFDSSLSFSESEKLLSYFSVPQIAVPMILNFFEERVGLLLNVQLSRLFEMILFEVSTLFFESNGVIDEVPVSPDDRKSKLGTELGVLMYEMEHDEELILSSIITICENCSKLCVGDSASGYVALLCFVLRNATRIESYSLRSRVLQSRNNNPQHDLLRTWMTQKARNQIRVWLSEAEDAENLHMQVYLHAHLFQIEMNQKFDLDETSQNANGKEEICESMSNFLISAFFVMTWCSNGIYGDVANDLNESLIQNIFFNYNVKKDQILQSMKMLYRLDRNQFEIIMDRIDGVALRKFKMNFALEISPVANQKSWVDTHDFVVYCEQFKESRHPYSAPVDIFDSVEFPGAAFIEVSFDTQTDLGAADYISFFKDEYMVEHWGKSRKYLGKDQSSWIRSGGKATLIIPANKFWYQLNL
jgi:hypothetical protein